MPMPTVTTIMPSSAVNDMVSPSRTHPEKAAAIGATVMSNWPKRDPMQR